MKKLIYFILTVGYMISISAIGWIFVDIAKMIISGEKLFMYQEYTIGR